MESCSPCKQFLPIVQQAAQESNIVINYIDAKENRYFVEKYGISSVPTIVGVAEGGTMVFKRVGVMAKQELLRLFSNIY